MADSKPLDREREGEGELVAVVALELVDPEGERPADLREESQARALVQTAVEPEHAKARAVVQRGVLKGPPARTRPARPCSGVAGAVGSGPPAGGGGAAAGAGGRRKGGPLLGLRAPPPQGALEGGPTPRAPRRPAGVHRLLSC